MVLCVKDKNWQVEFQNTECEKFCGNRVGKICTDGCREYEAITKLEKNVSLLKEKSIFNQLCDLLFLLNAGKIITIISSQFKRAENGMSFFDGVRFTKREQEIVTKKMSGFKNMEIARQLFISKATLKAHLNTIYKRLSQDQSRLLGKK